MNRRSFIKALFIAAPLAPTAFKGEGARLHLSEFTFQEFGKYRYTSGVVRPLSMSSGNSIAAFLTQLEGRLCAALSVPAKLLGIKDDHSSESVADEASPYSIQQAHLEPQELSPISTISSTGMKSSDAASIQSSQCSAESSYQI